MTKRPTTARQALDASMTEAEVQEPVVAALRACGFRFVHFRPALTRKGKWMTAYEGDDGWPDIIALKDGRELVLECKGTRGAKKPKNTAKGSELKRLIRWEQQAAWLNAFADAGAYARFVTPKNLDAVLEEIAR